MACPMFTEAALIAACTAAPGDALPRLVYADWLDERGDPRGEMVRVMEAMRPLPVWADEYQRLRPARNRLWASLDPAWLQTMGYQKVYRPLFGTMPEKREHRWRLAEEFIDVWHGGLKDGDGYSDAEIAEAEARIGVRLPEALREWYRLAGRRQDVWSVQDSLRSPGQIRIQEGDGLVFRIENQNCTRWYIRRDDLLHSDPPVFGGDEGGMVADSVTAFALFVMMYEAQFGSIWCEVHHIRPTPLLTMPERYQQTNLPVRYWFSQPVRFWDATDALIMCDDANEWWYAACRTEAAYQALIADFGERVVRVD